MWAQVAELSGLTDYDFICLIATYNDRIAGSKSKVDDSLEARGYTPEQIAATKQAFAEKFTPVVSLGLRFTKPFSHLKFEPFGYVLTLFSNYERGCLPFPGSVSEQPAQIMEIFSVLQELRHEQDLKLLEKSKAPKAQPRMKRK